MNIKLPTVLMLVVLTVAACTLDRFSFIAAENNCGRAIQEQLIWGSLVSPHDSDWRDVAMGDYVTDSYDPVHKPVTGHLWTRIGTSGQPVMSEVQFALLPTAPAGKDYDYVLDISGARCPS